MILFVILIKIILINTMIIFIILKEIIKNIYNYNKIVQIYNNKYNNKFIKNINLNIK